MVQVPRGWWIADAGAGVPPRDERALRHSGTDARILWRARGLAGRVGRGTPASWWRADAGAGVPPD